MTCCPKSAEDVFNIARNAQRKIMTVNGVIFVIYDAIGLNLVESCEAPGSRGVGIKELSLPENQHAHEQLREWCNYTVTYTDLKRAFEARSKGHFDTHSYPLEYRGGILYGTVSDLGDRDELLFPLKDHLLVPRDLPSGAVWIDWYPLRVVAGSVEAVVILSTGKDIIRLDPLAQQWESDRDLPVRRAKSRQEQPPSIRYPHNTADIFEIAENAQRKTMVVGGITFVIHDAIGLNLVESSDPSGLQGITIGELSSSGQRYNYTITYKALVTCMAGRGNYLEPISYPLANREGKLFGCIEDGEDPGLQLQGHLPISDEFSSEVCIRWFPRKATLNSVDVMVVLTGREEVFEF